MTFSLVGMCRRTGMFGAAVTTSNMNVGTRCPYAKAGVGAVLTQNRTDNRLGPQGIELLTDGKSAPDVIEALTADNPTIGWRQLAVIDREGGTGFYHGDKITSIHAGAEGDGCCAIGNIIRNDKVPSKMIEAFERTPDAHLAERLVQGLEAGLAAGSELKQIKSAALLVVHEQDFPLVDLRVEFDRDPLAELRFLWETYQPQMDRFVTQVIDPDSLGPPPV
ncbi:MAG: DUF1028 domain-containing protein [Rhodospirillaceae bacterium]|jgi:uncharacterized Ntn-hydrolase superfamily protein|nr:DUF1028 domain-containing protein [Rhodospirillaceae bacterium]MBT6607266.1 DUF1028 domain-containing protein [Rhodospirillaceae bacterium]MBT7510189.1 DUF1028 domain-containing protein [Rhodospirillaceae bacterium]